MQHVVAMNLQSLFDLLPDLTPNDQLLIERAYRRAETAHAGQYRQSGEPYFTHCLAVAYMLAEMKLDAEAIAAALLHDVVEDTNITLEEVRNEFGPNVARIVDGVSKLKKLPIKVDKKGSRTADRELEYFRKMLLAMGDDVRVVIVKLADRLHNMRTLGYMTPDKQRQKAQETLDIFAPLANRLGIWQMKWELEDLSFRYLQPETYKAIAKSLDERRPDRQAYIAQVTDVLRDALKVQGIDKVAISGRPKHIYGIYKKMERKQRPLSQIYDVRAVRVIVDTVIQCYQVLGVVHNLWRPIPGEFDDYIASPKDNFYRSLHTSILDNQGKTLEVQIRTWEMHENAEYGIAAHWRYKEGKTGARDEAFERRLTYLRRLMEFGPETEQDAATFVDTMKAEVFQDRVYVFTPKGDIVDLPNGATPIDFAYHIHTEIGHRCRGAKVQGRLVSLTHVLHTGDQVEILTSKRGGPSLDWLNPDQGYANTARSKEKIRQYFRKLDRDKHILNGREVLERELKRLGLDQMAFETVSQLFSYEKLDDFLAAVGSGDITGAQISGRILENERRQQQALAAQADVLVESQPQAAPDKSSIDVMGMGGMLTNLAHCCNPVYGDPIIGYVTRGQGVKVHRQDCSNIRALSEPERLIQVNWGALALEHRYPVPLEIVAYDREGLMRDISTVIADEKVSMTKVQVLTKQSVATFQITMEIGNFQQLTRILSRLGQVPNVIEARRRNMA
ncbi:MAG TPA: bifunctional (p)ppGpp synthetase/guanosine-3',5'-bis(diphosphate) 3'-pyrophosphohydrolase [Phototrophicaceae bacterium]|nr:bifunctional (p)ppGpp synthetase/guanosine-3',5'-bis(diphosphate) 3'-pyrophosphohydrolase [Phototrophicaceae bacterium]